MNYFFEYSCNRCGLIFEASFVFAGPHIKQVCYGCNAYVKFFDKKLIPDVKEIKIKIWAVVSQDVSLIEAAKKQIGFIPANGLTEKIMYWRLYIYLLNQSKPKPEQISLL